jgi:hypothetical protein
MHAMRILGLAAMMALTAIPLAAHAEPDQKNNRGYVVGKGGVARSANAPQPDGGEPGTTVPKQTQQATFGERVNAAPQQADNTGGPAAPTPAETANQPKPRSPQDSDRSILSIIR